MYKTMREKRVALCRHTMYHNSAAAPIWGLSLWDGAVSRCFVGSAMSVLPGATPKVIEH